jgi:peptide/nickel transport system substrate-binding protein
MGWRRTRLAPGPAGKTAVHYTRPEDMHANTRHLLALGATLAILGWAVAADAQKLGGILRISLRGMPPELSILETASSISTTVAEPMYNNLVAFDTFQPLESPDTIVPELAERWQWSGDGRALAFTLRRGVLWHDGKPFTSADVLHTFDVVRGVKRGGLKLNPRRSWYVNVEAVATEGDATAIFRLKRPQPSLLAMLAAGYSPIVPAHVNPGQLRTSALGTGPFLLKRFDRSQTIEIGRNPAYFKHGRPYLDGIAYTIFNSQPAEQGALIARQVDATAPLATPGPMHETLMGANVGIAFAERVTNATINLIVNTKRGPFTEPRLRRAASLAMDRNSLMRTVFKGGAVPGSALIPKPYGVWGLERDQLTGLPGFGDPAKNKAEARAFLADLGYTADKPFKVQLTTRNSISSEQSAVWAVAELKQVGIEAQIRMVDRGNWYGMVARRDFVFAINETAVAIDDPDATFYENYACGTERNYSDYCNVELMKKVDAQSQEADLAKRQGLVHEIDRQLQLDVARPYLAYRKDFHAHQPYVKNWVPHTSIYNGWRLDEVWLDK